jgi:adenosylcobyric acid synthase
MIGGTASHVGKSWMATGICRWLYRRGVRVAPFKAQNMSNNSYPCPGGGEIGRAQVAQAQACGLEPTPDMNPILLKPSSDVGSQVVVQGKVWRNLNAHDYYQQHAFLRQKVHESFERLAARYECIVVEGAGSIAELNLRQTDLVNTNLARHFQIPILLVADIDRGGVFASLYGTVALLDPSERDLVRAFAINRFRGDPSLFANAVPLLENKIGKPCLGVFPFRPDLHLDQEDSVDLDHLATAPSRSEVAVLRFPHISNHTDFRLFDSVDWIERPVNRQFRVIILPGTKSTISDLAWLRAQGLEPWLQAQHRNGATVLGLCGGYQMLGSSIEDPYQVESHVAHAPGLALLPVATTLTREKVTVAVHARTRSGHPFAAYEIHMGQTVAFDDADCFAYIGDIPEGILFNRCLGTYLHGAFENSGVLQEYLGLRATPKMTGETLFDQLADWFAHTADLPLFEDLFLS